MLFGSKDTLDKIQGGYSRANVGVASCVAVSTTRPWYLRLSGTKPRLGFHQSKCSVTSIHGFRPATSKFDMNSKETHILAFSQDCWLRVAASLGVEKSSTELLSRLVLIASDRLLTCSISGEFVALDENQRSCFY
ncbi:hypothetical protein JTE90_028799 [Oedothorax gibbosus]|uniref:Uncharacterized protein n=1 Tax=Oedothorax gibbosus TaxID=931172 RepID=A0AAV6VWK0_9ARAC|nr:hypothetical protein JTE90_028799 [Oedothorax gibbosus]